MDKLDIILVVVVFITHQDILRSRERASPLLRALLVVRCCSEVA